MFKRDLIVCVVSVALGVFLLPLPTWAGPGEDTENVGPSEVLLGSLIPVVTETGYISLSADGLGTNGASGIIQVEKPAGATVRSAFMGAASTGFRGRQLGAGDVKIDGVGFPWDISTPSSISSWNHWVDVTSIVKSKIDAAVAGRVDFTITEVSTTTIDGEILVVIFDDPSQPQENTIALFFGAQAIAGDNFFVNLDDPLDLSDPNMVLDMSLGISYGYQTSNVTVQVSRVDVNGVRLTSSAGGQDDGANENGALLTVGGLDDSNANPPPYATPAGVGFSIDDELYDLKPFASDGDVLISIHSINPSNDDNIFFASFFLTALGTVDPVPPVADVTPPTITCPSDIEVVCSDASGTSVSFTVTATDDTDPNPVVSCTPASGSIFPIGATTVDCTAADTAGNTASCSFTVTVTEGLGSIVGTLSADCSVLGITVDVFNSAGGLVEFGVTDAAGNYSIPGLPSGQTYTVSFVAPLGYTASPSEKQVDVLCNETATCDFSLDCPVNAGEQRTIGFWKHQSGVATGGKGNAQIDGATLCGYLDMIADHFNVNAINQVIVYQPPSSDLCDDKLLVLKALLNLKGSVDMVERAKQQLMALLLNVASGKLSQTAIISADGATVSQAITYCDNVIDDPAGDYETAKTICDEINNNREVPAGMIPLSTDNIAYKQGGIPVTYTLSQNFPNPFNPLTTITYNLPTASHVTLEVYNVMGQKVATVVDGFREAGVHSYEWGGSEFSSGVYFYRLHAGDFVKTRKMILMK